jgi:hypothetical protein
VQVELEGSQTQANLSMQLNAAANQKEPSVKDNFSIDDPDIKELSQNSDFHSTLIELNQEAINELRNEDA